MNCDDLPCICKYSTNIPVSLVQLIINSRHSTCTTRFKIFWSHFFFRTPWLCTSRQWHVVPFSSFCLKTCTLVKHFICTYKLHCNHLHVTPGMVTIYLILFLPASLSLLSTAPDRPTFSLPAKSTLKRSQTC